MVSAGYFFNKYRESPCVLFPKVYLFILLVPTPIMPRIPPVPKPKSL